MCHEQEPTQLITDLGNGDAMNATDATATFVFNEGGSFKVCYKLKVIASSPCLQCLRPSDTSSVLHHDLLIDGCDHTLKDYSGTVWQASVNFTQVGTELLTISTSSTPETEFREVV